MLIRPLPLSPLICFNYRHHINEVKSSRCLTNHTDSKSRHIMHVTIVHLAINFQKFKNPYFHNEAFYHLATMKKMFTINLQIFKKDCIVLMMSWHCYVLTNQNA